MPIESLRPRRMSARRGAGGDLHLGLLRRVEEAGEQHDERRAQSRAREHREGLQLGERAGAEEADRRRGDGRTGEHEVGAEPPGAERRHAVGEGELPLDLRSDGGRAFLHQLHGQDEQEHRRHEQQQLPRDIPWGARCLERPPVEEVPSLVRLDRHAELAVDLDQLRFLLEVAFELLRIASPCSGSLLKRKGAATRCGNRRSPCALRPPVFPVSCTARLPPASGQGQRPSALSGIRLVLHSRGRKARCSTDVP